MPVHTGYDSSNKPPCFAQWGNSGKKYYYTCGDEGAKDKAKAKANTQGQAIRASGWQEGKAKKETMNVEDYEYLLHHIEVDENGKEEIHHCFVYDHIGNMFEQTHLFIKDGKVYLDDKEITEGLFHVIKGLEPTQEVVWADDEAEDNGIKPKEMNAGMTLEEKSKEW